MATPFLAPEMERVLRIRHHRTIATEGYGMVAQLRSWLPDPVGGIYWFYVDNPFVSAYVPVYAGAQDVPRYIRTTISPLSAKIRPAGPSISSKS